MSKVIIITGGSEGLGKEIARKLAPSNKVIILARHEAELEAAAEEISCDFFVCDVTDNSQIEKTVSVIKKNMRELMV